MIEVNGRQSDRNEMKRERFSNFVVDLRPRAPKAARPSSASGEGSPHLSRRLADFFQRARSVLRSGLNAGRRLDWPHLSVHRPDFLNEALRSSRFFRFDLSAVSSLWRKKFKINDIFKLMLGARRRTPRPWLALIRERENIFRRQVARPQAARRFRWRLSSAWVFLLALFMIILPFQLTLHRPLGRLSQFAGDIVRRSEQAVDNLMAAADSAAQQDFRAADSAFQAAGADFLAAQEELAQINDALLSLAALSGDPKVKLAAESKKFLSAGVIASSLGRNLVAATDSLFNGDKTDFPAALDAFLDNGRRAVTDAMSLKKVLAAINVANLPEAQRARFAALSAQAGTMADSLAGLVSTGEQLKEVLGLSRDKRYLVVFQNNAELRASGGFLGSYALIDIRDGRLRNLEVPGGGAYDTEAGLKVRVAAPEPLWLVDTLWHFWDANWWPDWPATARNLMWFYEKSDGPSVDGVISVTPTVMEDLLRVTGPIDLTAEYGLVITADNFWENVQSVTEQPTLAKTDPAFVANLPTTSPAVSTTLPLRQGLEVNAANKPKKIIGDLLVKILEVLPQKLTPENLVKIMALFEDNMAGKQILMYFQDPALQAAAAERNWTGEVRSADKDYLLVVNTNIAGQKTDRLISDKIEHESAVAADGSIIDTLRISRTHRGSKGTPLTGVRNVDWLRVYVPAGSELLSAGGFRAPDPEYLQDRPDGSLSRSPLLAEENAAALDPASGTKIYGESGKTVFANWLMLDPGETATVTLRYRLPFNLYETKRPDGWLERLNGWLNPAAAELLPYSLLAQKQPGAGAAEFTSRLILPPDVRVFWRHPDDLPGESGWDISDRLDRDRYWSVLVQSLKSINE